MTALDLNGALERARALLHEPTPEGAGYPERLEFLRGLWARAQLLSEQVCDALGASELGPLLSMLDHYMDGWPTRLGEPSYPPKGSASQAKPLQEAPHTLWGDPEVDADACRGYRPHLGLDAFLAPGRAEADLRALPPSMRPHKGSEARRAPPPWWPCARALYGVSLDLGPWFFERMSEAEAVRGVSCWFLYNNQHLSRHSVARLVSQEGADLKLLSLSNSPLLDEGVAALCEASRCAHLRALHLHSVGMTREGAQALAGAACLPRLRALVLGGNALDEDALVEVLGGGRAQELRQLFLLSARLTPERAQRLFARVALPSLTHLYLSSNPMKDAGAMALARAEGLPRLQYVSLDACNVRSPALLAAQRPGVEWFVGQGAVFVHADEREG